MAEIFSPQVQLSEFVYVVWEIVPVCWVLCAKVRWPVDFVLSEIISNRCSVRKAAQLLERKISAQNVGKVL